MTPFHLNILMAERVFYEGDCVSLVVPSLHGQYGIQAHHSNTIAAIVPGMLEYEKLDGERVTAAVSNGLFKIEDNHVLILVETAELPEEIDENRAKRAAVAAKEAILQKKGIREYQEAQLQMARAMSRLRVHDRYESKRGKSR